jgi:hypothetical protein
MRRTRRTAIPAVALAAALVACAAAAAVCAGPAPASAAEDAAGPDVSRCPPIAMIKRQAGGLSGTNATMLARMTGVGSAICVWDPARPEAPARTIFDDPDGFIYDMSPSYDAARLLFAYKKAVRRREDSFHIYEINVDGTGLRQLTDGRYHDVSPAYLPDGRIVFVSTRVESYSLCQDFLACALYVMDSGGGDIRRIEFSTLCDLTPFVMDDGSILYSRWEYQDKNIFCTEALWTVNPDGSRVQLFYGNTLTVPNAMYGAKQVPGTDKVVCVMAAHHHPPIGAIGLLDRAAGMENPAALVNLTPEVPYTPTKGKNWRDTNWAPGDKFYQWSYADPWPLAADLFVVSYGGPAEGGPKRHRLFLMDDRGRKTPLYEDPATSCFNAVPLRPRPRPHVFPGDAPSEPRGEGTFFVQDVYQGLADKGVERGQVAALRIMGQVPKKYNTEGPRHSDHYPVIGEGTYYVKYNYGTVPVDADGTAYFAAPAGVELYFQALDAAGKEVRRMGTVTQLAPGEAQGCIGCHEPRTQTPAQDLRTLRRLARGPDRIAPPAWGAGPVDFARQVQPVLDRYCAGCHSGAKAEKRLDLSGDKTRLFNMAFETLVFGGWVERYHINPGPTGNFPPLATGSWVSRLTKRIEEKRCGVDMDDESRQRIYTWIDANVPYYGTWDMTRPHTLGGRDTWQDERRRPLPWFAALLAAGREAGVIDAETKGLRNADINLTHPAHSRLLLANLAKSAGGWANEDKATFKTAEDPRYRAVLAAIEAGRDALLARPRMDMPGAVPVPQKRDFGRTF